MFIAPKVGMDGSGWVISDGNLSLSGVAMSSQNIRPLGDHDGELEFEREAQAVRRWVPNFQRIRSWL